MIEIGFSLATYVAKIKQLLPMRAESESGHTTQAANRLFSIS